MLPEDVLLMMAQLGVAIAGFNGIANALQSRERRTPRRSVIGSILVLAATSVVVWSVLPLVLLTTSIPSARVWQIASLGWGIWQSAIMRLRQRQARKLGFDSSRVIRIWIIALLAVVALQFWNGLLWGEAWPHLVGVAASLLVALLAFFMLVHDDESVDS